MRKNDQLKVIGLVIMVIDHVALFLFGGIPWLYILARFIGFPFFAYGVAMGALHTSRPGAYLLRLLLFALVCQPFYMAATGFYQGNVVFTLFLGAASVMLWHRGNVGLKVFSLALCLLGGSWFNQNMGYGAYGVGMILAFSLGPGSSFFYHSWAFLYFALVGSVQGLAILSLPIIYYLPIPSFRLPRWFYYVSYPGHLAVIAIIKKIIFLY